MANLDAQPSWPAVRQLESHELARGGINGNMNEQAKALLARTEYLNQQKANKYEIVQGVFEFGTYAEFDAAKATLPANCTVVIGEANTTGTGTWGIGNNSWNGTVLKKSVYDPLIESKASAILEDKKLKLELGSEIHRLNLALQKALQTILSLSDQTDNDFEAVRTEHKTTITKVSYLLNGLLGLADAVAKVDLNTITLANTDKIDESNTLVAIANLSSAIAGVSAECINLGVNLELSKFNTSNAIQNTEYAIAINSELQKTSGNEVLRVKELTYSLISVINQILAHEVFSALGQHKKVYEDSIFLNEIAKLHNFDPDSPKSVSISANVVDFQVPTSVVRIDVFTDQSLPTAKGLVIQTLNRLKVDGQSYQCYGTLEVQGSSSASFPKKNWTLGFFSDETRTNAVSICLGDMMAHDELVFKSNFVDNTHCRNIAVNRLWHQMCEARSGWPKFEPDFVNLKSGVGLDALPTGATGHVDGYPAVIYINDAFYGIGSLNIGKKRANYNLKSNDQNHIQLDPNGGVNLYNLPMYPLDPATLGGTGEAFEIRRPSSWGEQAQANYTRLRNFLNKSQSEMQTLGIDNYINRQSMIDYIILVEVCCLWDHLHKNTLYTTWDGNVWHFMPYDVDTVWGLHFTGVYYDTDGVTQLHPPTTRLIPSSAANNNLGTLAKFKNIYGADIQNRYKYLRDQKIISTENILSICEKLVRTYPIELFKAENERWNLVPGGTIYQTLQQTGSLNQIKEWVTTHLTVCDTSFNYS